MIEKMGDYLRQKTKEPFSWRDNNCMMFVSGALEIIGVEPFPKEWCVGYNSAGTAMRHYLRALKEYGYSDIIDAVDDLFDREFTLHPRHGMIAARPTDDVMGYAMGVAYNNSLVFLATNGVIVDTPRPSDIIWRVL